jgi:hypothetical protein
MIVRAYDLEAEIRQHKFDNLWPIFEEGRAGDLTLKEQKLIGEYFRGSLKRPKGRPKDDMEHEFAQILYSEYQALRQYGMTADELGSYIYNNFTGDRNVLAPLRGKGLKRRDAIAKLAEIRTMGEKNVERLVDLGKKIERIESELHTEEGWY